MFKKFRLGRPRAGKHSDFIQPAHTNVSLGQIATGSTLTIVGGSGGSGWSLISDDLPEPKPDRPLTVTRRDLPTSSILWRVAKALPLTKETFLAGGCVRRHLEGYGQTEGDFDVYASNEGQAIKFADKMDATGWMRQPSPVGTISWTRSVSDFGECRIQLITHKTFDTPEECLKSFDFTINQGAVVVRQRGTDYWGDPDHEHKLLLSVEMERDVNMRVLRAVNPRSLNSLIKRIQKFVIMGYTMPDEEISALCKTVGGGEEGVYF